MSIKSIKLKATDVDKISYNTKSGDLTVYSSDGSVWKYLEVPSTVMSNIIDLKADKVSDTAIRDYLYKTALTKINRSRKLNQRLDRYASIQLKSAKGAKLSEELQSIKKDSITFASNVKVKEQIKNVKSSDIKTLRWFENGTLEVEFRSDSSVYSYSDVPKVYWNSLKNRNNKRVLNDPKTEKYSVGKFFQEKIVKHQEDFNYKKVEGK